MILFLHHRYRVPAGEERAVEDLMWLVRERLGEEATLVQRDSARVPGGRAAAGMLLGGLSPQAVGEAVGRTRARIVHVHNLHPTFGWRALAAAREAGAKVVMHLHQYRLVCAVGVCFTEGEDCTRCHGRNTLPGVLHNCRGSRLESAVYATALAAWQRRVLAHVDAFVVPSAFALERLHALGVHPGNVHVMPHVMRDLAPAVSAPAGPRYALAAARLAAEKGLEVAIEACARAGLPLVIAGEGPLRAELERLASARGSEVTFTGRLDGVALGELRRGAAVAVVPSLFGETFALSAAEAMASGVPVAASRIGALAELVPEPWLAAPGDADGLAAAITRALEAPAGRAEALERIRAITAPEVVAPQLRAVYASV